LSHQSRTSCLTLSVYVAVAYGRCTFRFLFCLCGLSADNDAILSPRFVTTCFKTEIQRMHGCTTSVRETFVHLVQPRSWHVRFLSMCALASYCFSSAVAADEALKRTGPDPARYQVNEFWSKGGTRNFMMPTVCIFPSSYQR
jgi:hypothetical protein